MPTYSPGKSAEGMSTPLLTSSQDSQDLTRLQQEKTKHFNEKMESAKTWVNRSSALSSIGWGGLLLLSLKAGLTITVATLSAPLVLNILSAMATASVFLWLISTISSKCQNNKINDDITNTNSTVNKLKFASLANGVLGASLLGAGVMMKFGLITLAASTLSAAVISALPWAAIIIGAIVVVSSAFISWKSANKARNDAQVFRPGAPIVGEGSTTNPFMPVG